MSQLLLVLCLSSSALAGGAPYTAARGSNAPMAEVQEEVRLPDGRVQTVTRHVKPAEDTWGNAAGNDYDLVVDGAFEGQSVAVLHFYTGEGFDFSLPRAALAEKGLSVYRWANQAPSPEELAKGLDQATQLWIISDDERHLTEAHLDIIDAFFEEGHGVYIWGDNEPYYSDANAVATRLFDATMLGNLHGNQTVGLADSGVGLAVGHDITTGLEHLYEGITIATIQPNAALTPLMHGSAGNLVTAVYEQDGKRAILDGGFTRLYINWDTAGTARYVKNAAAWLVNYERFGDAVLN